MSQGVCKTVDSNQEGVHPDLEELVCKHIESTYRKPIASHTAEAFAQAMIWRVAQGMDKPLILDSGCGTGESSWNLARLYPDHLVIGLDKSEARLAKFPGGDPVNMLLLRADVVDFWMLAVSAGWRLARHALFYPNPWPKSRHVMRRFHAHPIWPELLRLGGILEVRTNWRVYVEECDLALSITSIASSGVQPWKPVEPWTAFERKYLASGHELWSLIATIPSWQHGVIPMKEANE